MTLISQRLLSYIGVFALIIFSKIALSPSHASDDILPIPPSNSVVDGKANVLSLNVGTGRLSVEIAKTENERQLGLMWRRSLSLNTGMLFIFDQATPRPCLWMKDTQIPLSAAYINNDDVIAQIENLASLSQEKHCAQQDTRYIIEANRGWFQNHGVVPGKTQIKNLSSKVMENLTTP